MKNNVQKNNQVWQFVRLMLISGSAFLFISTMVLVLLGWRYQENIKEVVAENLGKQFSAELQFGDIRLNLLRSFPLATITISDLSIKGTSVSPKEKNLLRAESIHLQFNLINILKKEYSIIQLVINNGSFQPLIDQNGNRNFDFSPPANDSNMEQMQFEVRRLVLRNMDVTYNNHQNKQHFSASISDLRSSGQLNGKNTWLKISGNFHLNELQFDDLFMADLDIDVEINTESGKTGEWIVHQSNISINGQGFELSGILNATDEGVFLTHAMVRSHKLQIAQIISQLPTTAKKKLQPFKPGGFLTFEAIIDGLVGKGHMPHISSNLRLKNASFTLADYGIRLESIDLQAVYSNGDAGTPASSQLNISNFSARTTGSNSRINGRINIRNFVDQQITLNLVAETTAEELIKIANMQNLAQAKGRVKLDISFSGNRNIDMGFTSNNLLQAKLSGKMDFSELNFIINNKKNLHYHQFSGSLQFNDNQLTAERITGRAGNSDFMLSGSAGNLLPYLFLPGEHLFVEANMRSSIIMLDELLYQGESNDNEEAYRLKLPKRLHLKLNTNIDQLNFKRFHAESIQGTARMTGQQIHADRLIFNTMDGQVMMTGIIDARAQTNILMHTEARLEDVDINQLFYQTGNFGQTTILDDNIYGSVTADMFFSAVWSEHLHIDWESMETIAKLRIDNGRLLNFAPMIALGRFIRTDELDDVSFSTIENHIQIKNRNIMIPMMEVSSNVLNMQLQGEHSFENEIDYRLRVLLSDLLSRQHRERRNPQEEYGEIIDDGLGRTTLFLRLSGTTHDPALSYDQEGVREKLRDDIRDERQNLRDILRKEFSFFSRQNKDSLDKKENARESEQQLIRKQEEEGFIIEWE